MPVRCLPTTLCQQCAALADALQADAKRFTPSDSWSVVRDMLLEVADQDADSRGALVTDTIALLEGTLTPEAYRSKWAGAQDTHGVIA